MLADDEGRCGGLDGPAPADEDADMGMEEGGRLDGSDILELAEAGRLGGGR